ncbi:MAG: phosphatidylserine decarboxylase family protein [Sphingobacteriales bacterium]|nr:MAG: phosphatidylserine decarboxylase family protein [Sphingobacteriales bacterium]
MTLHREGTKYILLATLFWIAIGTISWMYVRDIPILFGAINLVCFLLWFWIVWFFRLPKRDFSTGENVVIAPADGKVVVIEETYESEYFKDQRLQVSIFMSPLNVHVNRVPIDGVVKYMKYHAGKYLVAWHPKSSTENERTTMVIENPHATLLLRQIAGALARRIKYYVKEGQQVQQNEEFGFIRFGSRVDIFFPVGTQIDVKIGETVQGGITVLGKIGVHS